MRLILPALQNPLAVALNFQTLYKFLKQIYLVSSSYGCLGQYMNVIQVRLRKGWGGSRCSVLPWDLSEQQEAQDPFMPIPQLSSKCIFITFSGFPVRNESTFGMDMPLQFLHGSPGLNRMGQAED